MRSVFLLLLACQFAAAADPPQVRVARTVRSDPAPGVPVLVPQGRFYPVDLEAGKAALFDTDEKLVRIVVLKPGERLINQTKYDESEDAPPADYDFPDSKSGVALIFARASDGQALVKSYYNGASAPERGQSFLIQCGEMGRKPRPPKPVPPVPVDPVNPPSPVNPPVPVSSFRVIFVVDSGAAGMTPQQVSIANSVPVRQWLDANCSKDGTYTGWRVYAKTTDATNELPAMKAVWTAALPKIADNKCIVIQVNDKITIEPYPADAPAALALLKKYKGN